LNLVSSQNMGGFLKEAWKYVLQNHPHDSICGCSISRVHMDNEYRFNQAIDLAQEVIHHDMNVFASKINTVKTGKPYSVILFNASQKVYEGIVETDIELSSSSQEKFMIFDKYEAIIPYQILGVKKGTIKGVFEFGRLPEFQLKDIYHVAFNVVIPAVGYSVYGYEEYKDVAALNGDYTFKEFYPPTRYTGTMQTGHRTWENEFLKVTINDNGTLNVSNKQTGKEYRDLLIFEDGADVGDGWNYRKPLKDSRYLSLTGKTDFSIENDGPMVVCWKITQTMNIPVGISPSRIERSVETSEFKITTLVKMKNGSSKLEFNTSVDNNISEHRLRVLFPTYLSTDKFYSSTPFYLQERNIIKPDRSNYAEFDTGVFPNQGVVMLKDNVDCFALYNKGLYEIEIMEDTSRTVALTLFRSFKNEVGRDKGELNFMKRNINFEYALEFAPADIGQGDIMISGELWRSGVMSTCTDNHIGSLDTKASFLNIDIPGAVLSSFKSGKEGMTVIRLYNCTDDDTEGTISLYSIPKKVFLLDLNEQIIEEKAFKNNTLNVQLKPAKILTLGLIM